MTKQTKLTEAMKTAFADLCEENPPRAFVAITVGEDMMVNFASYGVENAGTIELLEHMLEYIRSKESEDEFGKQDDTTVH
jgi:hypothetical protein